MSSAGDPVAGATTFVRLLKRGPRWMPDLTELHFRSHDCVGICPGVVIEGMFGRRFPRDFQHRAALLTTRGGSPSRAALVVKVPKAGGCSMRRMSQRSIDGRHQVGPDHIFDLLPNLQS